MTDEWNGGAGWVEDKAGNLHKTINDQTWKLITWTTGLGAALVAATCFLARHVP